jgi:hypothetical protein
MAAELVELEIVEEELEEETPVEYDIATYPSDFTLGGIHEMWHKGDIEIPPFQRAFVWKIEQSSLLIESFLLGLPVPNVFFYIDDQNKNLVIDGQQRILSIVYFIDGHFGEENTQEHKQVFRLKGLDERGPYHNLRFVDLSDSDRRKLQNSVLRAINVRQLSPTDENTSIYHIFERLNTGGTALKPQEIRNCVFRGAFAETLHKLNEDPNWRSIVGRKDRDKHQRDVELILRVFALSRKWESYEKPMKEYLNQAMKRNQRGNSNRVTRYVSLFTQTCEVIVETLGEKPFHLRGPLNASVLDAVFCTLLDNLATLPPDLKNRYSQLTKDESFLAGTRGSTTNTQLLKDRFTTARDRLVR